MVDKNNEQDFNQLLKEFGEVKDVLKKNIETESRYDNVVNHVKSLKKKDSPMTILQTIGIVAGVLVTCIAGFIHLQNKVHQNFNDVKYIYEQLNTVESSLNKFNSQLIKIDKQLTNIDDIEEIIDDYPFFKIDFENKMKKLDKNTNDVDNIQKDMNYFEQAITNNRNRIAELENKVRELEKLFK